ncbi:Arc-like DNA binding domain-containing protein [Cupriavidus necator]|uniref:Arc family DNA-binding protein n=1 Tax=Cupriavidus necator TaxID=106590 RepID=UPI003F7415AD
MKQQDSQMKIRLPLGLKFWLVSQARLNRRSVNAEVVYQLESVKTKENAPTAATVEALDAK